MISSYRRHRIRRHVLFFRARLNARTRAFLTRHDPVQLRGLVTGWFTIGALAFAAMLYSAAPAPMAVAPVTPDAATHAPSAPPAPATTTPAPSAAPAPGTGPAPGNGSTPAPGPLTDPVPASTDHHTVAAGETLATIAQRYQVPMEQIAAANHLSDPNRITTGQRLRIPPAPERTIVITWGSTLGGIARAHHVATTALLAANPGMTDPDRILAGTGLQLPAA